MGHFSGHLETMAADPGWVKLRMMSLRVHSVFSGTQKTVFARGGLLCLCGSTLLYLHVGGQRSHNFKRGLYGNHEGLIGLKQER